MFFEQTLSLVSHLAGGFFEQAQSLVNHLVGGGKPTALDLILDKRRQCSETWTFMVGPLVTVRAYPNIPQGAVTGQNRAWYPVCRQWNAVSSLARASLDANVDSPRRHGYFHPGDFIINLYKFSLKKCVIAKHLCLSDISSKYIYTRVARCFRIDLSEAPAIAAEVA